MDTETAARLCRNTCKHSACTGRGSLSRWAHRCQLAPLPELPPVPCSRKGCDRDSVGMLPDGRVCCDHMPPQPTGYTLPEPEARPRRAYGPHDPATAPMTVTVLGSGRWPTESTRPRPTVLVKQRAAINRLAAQP